MKRIITSLSFLLICISAIAQNKSKTDKVYLNDGSTLEVEIKKVGTTSIEYNYPGESAQNEEQVSNIRTIVFASGRVQQFKTGAQPLGNTDVVKQANIQQRTIEPNSLAILPVVFYDKATGTLMEDLSKLAQSRIYDFFEDDVSKISPLKMQDTRNTNSFLKKADVNFAALDETPVEDIENILGAEYVVLSKVTCDIKNNTTVNESNYGSNEKKGNKNTAASQSSTRVDENKQYNYVVVLEIYKGGQKIYNETRKPFLTMEDSWKDAMEYMLKRAPIYKRK